MIFTVVYFAVMLVALVPMTLLAHRFVEDERYHEGDLWGQTLSRAIGFLLSMIWPVSLLMVFVHFIIMKLSGGQNERD